MRQYEGKVVLVTGGAGHIGRAICQGFLNEGAQVVACGRRSPEEPIGDGSEKAEFFPADLRDPDASKSLVDFALERFGRIDILINNAGGSPPVDAASASPRLTEKIVALNLVAPLVLSQQAHGALSVNDSPGCIVNIASVSGVRPSPGTAAYGAAKAGLLSSTRSLAMEWGPKIRVNAIVVGLVHNDAGIAHYGGAEGFQRVADMLPLKRMAAPEDVANAVLMLCDDKAAYISGAALEVDGGGEVPVFLHLASEASKAD
ncbi:MAG: SDR family oxidoreductase [Halieaceae bacterium]|jgi:NAD(P)-dependent dehydrogenase (short-subunit alcohol dehydrogenase family)|uniref:Oxidoreductase, short chain dehydrogenase/reductase family n=1 Tax=uncultured marine bacterium 442 TaxID=257392 RepID=Q6SH63_9BACT|nr:oxidoreductase, short chain dehydrogenase/reductase family [uncultured marine bacterium 442]MBT4854094.1 SDR family oxidoreductase [Halieaceae bacterium]MDG1493398.1 SDR family oxidoreductase [Luminiphilus sp.]MBT5208510.1 SDR family oxidoreductase [Halieaceae bacterium]MBT6264813.1 SDR family oxidoreductase [Halieaceae bacterium]